ncbi:MAG: efflux RND transporter periplasmic adaptor subunit [Gammaproteobacteria bacterium]|nr:efflux RND transporter periplasmic adaptor subunit [Gammaproteobacteria bacterium]
METTDQDSIKPMTGNRSKRKRFIGVALVLLLASAGGYYWFTGQEQEAADQPLIVTVEIGNIENTVTAAGSLQPFDFVDVGAQVSGQLQILHVEVGDIVEQGQLLAEIDARVQESRVEASRASIEAQEAQIAARRASLELARANKERQERLKAADATSELDYDNAINSLASAEASLIQLEKQIIQSLASLESDETQLEFSKIYAPAAGTVVSIEMNEGRTLNANQQAPNILRIADLNTMTVETEISEADISQIKKDMEVYFTTLGGGNRRWYSAVRQILPTPVIENNVVLYTGLFDIDNSDDSLLSEMTAQVYFVTSSAQNVLTVPVGALTFLDGPGQVAAGAGLAARAGAAGANGGGRPAGFGGGQGAGGGAPEGLTEEARARLRERIASGEGFAGGQGRGAAGAQAARRLASVNVVRDDGSFEEREIMIGVTSRIAAEVISGLELGDRVVAGILQAGTAGAAQNAEGGDRREMFRAMGGFR